MPQPLTADWTEGQAEEISALGPQVATLVFLVAVQRIAQQNDKIAEQQAVIAELKAQVEGPPKIGPSTPSGQRPFHTKPSAPKRKAKAGAKPGHAGTRRPKPRRIDEHKAHRLEACPDCGGELQRCDRTRTRTIEDILEDLRTVVTEHTIHRDYCPACKKHVEPVVPDALPNAAIGHRTAALSSWLHYGVGVSIAQVRELLGGQFQTHLSAGGLAAVGVGGGPVCRRGRLAPGQTLVEALGRVVHVLGLPGRAVRQQPGRADDSARGDPAEDQPIQPKREGRGRPGGADERVPHVEASRP